MKSNKLKEAYLLSREYALKLREPNSTNLMLEAQKNLLDGFIEYCNNNNITGIMLPNISSEKIMNFGSDKYKKNITNLILNYDF